MPVVQAFISAERRYEVRELAEWQLSLRREKLQCWDGKAVLWISCTYTEKIQVVGHRITHLDTVVLQSKDQSTQIHPGHAVQE